MLSAMSAKETISPMALPPWSSGGQFHFLRKSGFCGSFSKTSILFLGINSKEVVENTGERLLLLVTASGMNADVSTIRPGWSNEDGPDDFSETGSRGWPQGCCDDALHSVYDTIAISLAAGNSWSCQSAYQCTKKTTILILQDLQFLQVSRWKPSADTRDIPILSFFISTCR